MKILIDDDVALVADFMLRNVRGTRLQCVAHAISAMADMVWIPDERTRSCFRVRRDENLVSRPGSEQPQESTQLR